MAFEDITADLPPPRDDEPESLRQDILDELADHLACALDREQQRQSAFPETCESPRERTLKRFGNPAQIALGLWWDAMWGKIMTQRVLVALCGLLAVACCAAVFAAVRLVGLQERALADQRAAWEAQQLAAAQQQRELAQTLQTLRDQFGRSTQNLEWVPVTVRLVGPDGQSGVPAGFRVELRMIENRMPLAPWREVTDAQGVARFPNVHYGQAQVNVEAPWGSAMERTLQIPPGEPLEVEIACPVQPPEQVVVLPRFELPDDLKSRRLYFGLAVGDGYQSIGTESWATALAKRDGVSFPARRLLVGGQGDLRWFDPPRDEDLYLAYGTNGVFEGVRLAGAGLVPQWQAVLFLAHDTSTEKASTAGSDGPESEAPPPRLFEFMHRCELKRDFDFDLDTETKRVVIRLTEAGLESLRRSLSSFDSARPPEGDRQISLGFAKSERGARLPPLIASSRPKKE